MQHSCATEQQASTPCRLITIVPLLLLLLLCWLAVGQLCSSVIVHIAMHASLLLLLLLLLCVVVLPGLQWGSYAALSWCSVQ
jgi:hypothetical protein